MKNHKILALDLEGTLISNAMSQIPRPGLLHFLNKCSKIFDRIVIYTAVDEGIFRRVARQLVVDNFAPNWFSSIEYIAWDKSIKDLSNIDCNESNSVLIVDDMEEYIHPCQKDLWIKIDPFINPYSDKDKELTRVIGILNDRCKL